MTCSASWSDPSDADWCLKINGMPDSLLQVSTGGCILNNMLKESELGVAAGVHVYLQHVNASDPTSPLEDQLPHMAAFLLAREEHWYYFGSTGWWDDSFSWNPLFDKAAACGKPLGPATQDAAGLVFTRKFAGCEAKLTCHNKTAANCVGDISF